MSRLLFIHFLIWCSLTLLAGCSILDLSLKQVVTGGSTQATPMLEVTNSAEEFQVEVIPSSDDLPPLVTKSAFTAIDNHADMLSPTATIPAPVLDVKLPPNVEAIVLLGTDVETPRPRDNEVLVKVKASSLNFGDVALIKGQPLLIRLMGFGLFKPKNRIPGGDVAGLVESVGSKAMQLSPGDKVFCDLGEAGMGAYAEYIAVPEDLLIRIPESITFEQAASVAIEKLLKDAGPVVLEPIMSLQVVVPQANFGATQGSLLAKRGLINDCRIHGNMQIIDAKVPLAELFGYSSELRSITAGRGTFTMEPLCYEKVPEQVAKQILF